MKTAIKIFLGITILLLFIVGFAIVNSHVSLTYEIEEPKMMFKERASEIEEKAKYLRELIFWLKSCFIYLITNTIFLIWILRKTKDKKSTNAQHAV